MKKKIIWIVIIIIITGALVFYKSNNNSIMKTSNDSKNIQAEIDSNINSELELDAKISDLENRPF